jgi:GDP-D-mannose dehydratase
MVNSQRKILVTGATGQQGGSLARLLLQKNIKYMPLLEILNHLQLKTSEIEELKY